jgi:hypothetical protein
MRSLVTRGFVLLLLAWGCGGTSNYFPEESGGRAGDGGTSRGGTSQGGTSQGGTSRGGASGGVGGVGGGSGGAAGAGRGGNGGRAGSETTGGRGGVSGAAGLGGAGGSVLGGTGGSARAGQAGTSSAGMGCSDPDASAGGFLDTRVRSKTSGTNGSFTDECDASGNLVEYACEVGLCTNAKIAVPIGGFGGFAQGGAGGITMCLTGNVSSRTIDCGGHCDEGTCFGWCATQGGEAFNVTGVDGSALTMTMGNYEYTCSVAFQREGYDCLDQELVGRSMVVTSLGNCTGASTTWGWDDLDSSLIEECAFTCTLD